MATNQILLHSQRIIYSSLANIWRNKFLSLATIGVMGIILFIFNIIISINLIANSVITLLNEKVDIIIYLQDNTDPLEVNNLLNSLKELPEVKEITYTSKEDALQEILGQYPGQDDPFKKFGLENKLPANIRIIAYQPQEHTKIISFIKESRYADLLLEVNDNQENQDITNQLIHLTDITKKILFSILIAFILGGILIIVNAIQITIGSRRKEIKIMHLVGASPLYIRLPFILEGVIYGLLAFLINVLLLIFFIKNAQLTSLGLNIPLDKISFILLLEIILTLLISISSSFFAVQKHLQNSLDN